MNVEVTAEDKAGETFTGWTVEGVEVADKNSKKLNFKMPANDVTLTANYTTNSYTLTVNGQSEQKAYNEDIKRTIYRRFCRKMQNLKRERLWL